MKINSNTIKLEKKSHVELENIIKKIAVDNKIENVGSVEVKLSKNNGVVKFAIIDENDNNSEYKYLVVFVGKDEARRFGKFLHIKYDITEYYTVEKFPEYIKYTFSPKIQSIVEDVVSFYDFRYPSNNISVTEEILDQDLNLDENLEINVI